MYFWLVRREEVHYISTSLVSIGKSLKAFSLGLILASFSLNSFALTIALLTTSSYKPTDSATEMPQFYKVRLLRHL